MKVTKTELKEIYDNNTVSEAMTILGINSPPSFYRLLKRAGIEIKNPERAQRTPVKIEIVD